jgi:hypothetical protein
METNNNQPGFFSEVNETFFRLLKNFFGPVVLLYMGYKVYHAVTTGKGFLISLLAILLGIIGAVVITYLIAFIITPILNLEKKRIQRLEREKNVFSLLGSVYSAPSLKIFNLACDAVVRLGNYNAPLLIEALDETKCPVRSPFGNRLASNSNIRAGAAYCLGKLQEKSAVSSLILALYDKEWDVRYFACQALGEIGDKGALDLLVKMASADENESVKKAANEAVEKISA